MVEDHGDNKTDDKLSSTSPRNGYKASSSNASPRHCNVPDKVHSGFVGHDNGSVSRKRKRGRKRRGRSMGRNPFLTYSRQYIDEHKAYLEKSTIEEQTRKLKYIGRTFNWLKSEGRLETANPRKITEKEIAEFMLWMKEKDIHPNTQVKYLQLLNNVLRQCGNSTIDVMRGKKLLPSKISQEISSLSEEEIQHIINSASRIPGWNGIIATFFCAFYPYTGLRPSELRLAQKADLNEEKWYIWVRNPKGKNRYGVQRSVPIPTPVRVFIHDFLQLRKEHLKQHGISECEPLIPRITPKGEVTYYSNNHFRRIKRKIEAIAGINFKIKDFRASYAQMLIDKEVPLQSVSKAMGHSTTETTELYYARIRDISMFNDINNAWLDRPDAKNPRISVLAR